MVSECSSCDIDQVARHIDERVVVPIQMPQSLPYQPGPADRWSFLTRFGETLFWQQFAHVLAGSFLNPDTVETRRENAAHLGIPYAQAEGVTGSDIDVAGPARYWWPPRSTGTTLPCWN